MAAENAQMAATGLSRKSSRGRKLMADATPSNLPSVVA
jgi:hypothetical protein